MVERFGRLGITTKAFVVLAAIGALIGCSYTARRFLLQQEPAFEAQDARMDGEDQHHPSDWYTLTISEAGWTSEWFSPGLGPNTFHAKAAVGARHSFVWIL